MFFFLLTLGSLVTAGHAIPQTGTFDATGIRLLWFFRIPWFSNSKTVDLTSSPLGSNAQVAVGITRYSTRSLVDISCTSYANNIKPDGSGFDVHLDSPQEISIGDQAAWFAFGEADGFRTGTFTPASPHSDRSGNPDVVEFWPLFTEPPRTLVFLSSFDERVTSDFSLGVIQGEFSERVLTMLLYASNALGGRDIYSELVSATATWIAWPADKEFVDSGTAWSENIDEPNLTNGKYVEFTPGIFTSAPKVFIALQSFDLSRSEVFRLKVYATDITELGFTWHCDGWADDLNYPMVYECGVSWLAFA